MGICLALGGLGLVAWGCGGSELVRAREHYEESLAICREAGQRGQIIVRLAVLGHICNALEAYDVTQTYCEEAIMLGRDIDFRMGLSFALSALGEALTAQSDFKPARAALLESIELAAGINDYSELFTALINWVEYLLCAGCRAERDQPDFSSARQQQLVDILTLALSHPSSRQVFRVKASRLLGKMEPTLTKESLVRVKTSSDLPDLDTIVAEILQEPDRPAM
jgi:tetratricopeptide (TPR) repeat protein